MAEGERGRGEAGAASREPRSADACRCKREGFKILAR